MDKEKKQVDPATMEFRAIRKINAALATLSDRQKARVMNYVADSCGGVGMHTPPGPGGSMGSYQIS